jgi:hypothetical protein
MISFSLLCDNGHEFDGWFRNGAAFDEQASAGALACPVCGSEKVEKGLMAPSIPAKSNRADDTIATKKPVYSGTPDPKVVELMEQVRRLRKHVEDTAEYVGDKFPEEARKIHYEETEKRGIFGEASVEEARDLLDEGVEVLPVPSLPEDHN